MQIIIYGKMQVKFIRGLCSRFSAIKEGAISLIETNTIEQSKPSIQNLNAYFENKQKYPILDLIDVPSITRNDIQNFDQYYNTQTVSEFRKDRGKKFLLKRYAAENMKGFPTKYKIRNNYQNLIDFLAIRDDKITDVELAFCLQGLFKHHKRALQVIQKNYLPKIIDMIEQKKIKFFNLENILDLLEIHLQTKFLTDKIIQIMQLTVLEHLEAKQSLPIVFKCFYLFVKVQESKETQTLIHLGKMLSKESSVLNPDDLYHFFKICTKYQNLLQIDQVFILRLEEEFLIQYENYKFEEKVLSILNYQLLICSKMTNYLQKSSFANRVFQEFLNLGDTDIDIYTDALKIFSAYDLNLREEQNFWQLMECSFPKLDQIMPLLLSQIIQVFGQSRQGSLKLWIHLKSLLTEDNYADKFSILQNLIRLGNLDKDLIDYITEEELRGSEFKYMKNQTISQKIEIFKTFAISYHLYGEQKPSFQKVLKMLFAQIQFEDDELSEIFKSSNLRISYFTSLLLLEEQELNQHQKQQLSNYIKQCQKKYNRQIEKERCGYLELMQLQRFLSVTEKKKIIFEKELQEQIERDVSQKQEIKEIFQILEASHFLQHSMIKSEQLILRFLKLVGSYNPEQMGKIIKMFKHHQPNEKKVLLLEVQMIDFALREWNLQPYAINSAQIRIPHENEVFYQLIAL